MIITHTLEDTTIENVLKTFEGFYLNKNYSDALLLLEKNQKLMDAGLWHYNMGTVLAQMNNWPLARYHFMSAQLKGMDSNELHQNKVLVEEKLEVERLEKPLTTSDYLLKAGMVASDGPLVSLSLIFLVIGLWLLKKTPSLKSAALFLVVVTAPLMLDWWIDSWPRKIVLTQKNLHDGPSALFGVHGEIPPGVMVLTNAKGDWEEVIYPSRFSGWVKTDGMKRLELK